MTINDLPTIGRIVHVVYFGDLPYPQGPSPVERIAGRIA